MSGTSFGEIPLSSSPQTFNITLNGVQYQLTFVYREDDALADPAGAPGGGWCLDIAASDGLSILAGIPLVTGCDLLAQYQYLGLGFQLFVATDGEITSVPTYSNLGTTSHLYYVLL